MHEHARQVVESLQSPDEGTAACSRFVASFIRPYGLDEPATPRLVAALEQLASQERSQPATMPAHLYPLRALLWLVGLVSVYKNPSRVIGTIRKQLSIMKKRMRNTRKSRARGRVSGPADLAGESPAAGRPQENASEPTRRVG
jgi:hypothetical protein